jgi:hypothetical protein
MRAVKAFKTLSLGKHPLTAKLVGVFQFGFSE